MATRNLVSMTVLVLTCATLSFPSVSAWSNGGYSADQNNPDYGTHDWIADSALAIQTLDVAFLKNTYHSRFLLGTEAPDNPAFIGDTTKHHIYFTASAQLSDDASADRASEMYGLAVGYFNAGDYSSAAYDIGVMAHYIADPGVFGHTMGAYTDWGAETHHSDYENEVNSRTGSLTAPTGLALGNSDAYTGTVDLGRVVTFGSGTIKSNVWMDTNYNWADGTFVSSAMASLDSAVYAVAAAINHMMIDVGASPPGPTPRPPGAPVSVMAVQGNSVVVVSWEAPSDDGGAAITGYRVFRGTSLDNPTLMATTLPSVTSWADEALEQETVYYYWVVAENSIGSSGMSQPATANIGSDHSSWAIPIAVSAASIVLASVGALLWRGRARGRTRP